MDIDIALSGLPKFTFSWRPWTSRRISTHAPVLAMAGDAREKVVRGRRSQPPTPFRLSTFHQARRDRNPVLESVIATNTMNVQTVVQCISIMIHTLGRTIHTLRCIDGTVKSCPHARRRPISTTCQVRHHPSPSRKAVVTTMIPNAS